MKILYVAMAHDYGDPARGRSFEETNFRSALEGMGHEIVPFDFMAGTRKHGKREMNRRLVACAKETSPDLSFFVLFQDEVEQETIRAVSHSAGRPSTGSPTIIGASTASPAATRPRSTGR